MRLTASAALVLLLSLWPGGLALAQSPEEMVRLVSQVNVRLMKGDASALEDLKSLPDKEEVPALLMFFRQHFSVYGTDAVQRKAIAEKAAHQVAENPGTVDYVRGIFSKDPTRPTATKQQRLIVADARASAIEALAAVKSKFAVWTVGSLFDLPNFEGFPDEIAKGLAKMDLPGAPHSSQNWRSAGSDAAVAQWRAWWAANKANYTP